MWAGTVVYSEGLSSELSVNLNTEVSWCWSRNGTGRPTIPTPHFKLHREKYSFHEPSLAMDRAAVLPGQPHALPLGGCVNQHSSASLVCEHLLSHFLDLSLAVVCRSGSFILICPSISFESVDV